MYKKDRRIWIKGLQKVKVHKFTNVYLYMPTFIGYDRHVCRRRHQKTEEELGRWMGGGGGGVVECVELWRFGLSFHPCFLKAESLRVVTLEYSELCEALLSC